MNYSHRQCLHHSSPMSSNKCPDFKIIVSSDSCIIQRPQHETLAYSNTIMKKVNTNIMKQCYAKYALCIKPPSTSTVSQNLSITSEALPQTHIYMVNMRFYRLTRLTTAKVIKKNIKFQSYQRYKS